MTATRSTSTWGRPMRHAASSIGGRMTLGCEHCGYGDNESMIGFACPFCGGVVRELFPHEHCSCDLCVYAEHHDDDTTSD